MQADPSKTFFRYEDISPHHHNVFTKRFYFKDATINTVS